MAFDVPIPGLDEPLRLAPRWGEDNPFILALLFLAPVLVGGLLVWLFRWEARLVQRRAAFLLLSFRLLVVLVLWWVACFEPKIVEEEGNPGPLLVALDISGSMDVADPRSPQDQLRLARLLRVKEAAHFPPELLEQWIEGLDRGTPVNELPLLMPDEAGLEAEAKGEQARARQKDLTLLLSRMETLSRREIAQKILGEEGWDLLNKLRARHPVEFFTFSDEVFPGLDARNKEGSPLQEMGTNLRLPLKKARKYRGGDEPSPRLILLSDGRHNLGERPGKGDVPKLPLFPIALGPRTPEPDLALVAPRSIKGSRGATLELKVQVKVWRMPAQEIVVEVFKKGDKKPLVEPNIITHEGNRGPAAEVVHTTSFHLKFEEAGGHPLEVKVRPANPEAKELTLRNNFRETMAQVTQDKPRILLVDGEARWEYRHLSAYLIRAGNLEVERVLFHQPRLGILPEEALEKSKYPLKNLPVVAEEKTGKPAEDPLFTFDCIVLGDVAPEDLPLKERVRLRRFVTERGGTLVLVAGKSWFPLAYLDKDDTKDPLIQLLPIFDPRPETPKEKGFGIGLTEMGKATRWLSLEDDPVQSAKVWAELPGHFWGLTGKAKPGATVLAVTVGKEEKGKKEERSLIVEQNVGKGRVLWLGLESTWRFRAKKGYLHHERLWGQLLLWAATKDVLPAGNVHVRFGSREPVYEPDQEVDLAVRLGPEVLLPGPKESLVMKLFRILPEGKEEPAREVILQAHPSQPRLFEARPRDMGPGRYRAEPVSAPLDAKIKEALKEKGGDPTFLVLPVLSKEMDDPSPDRRLLEELADASGGKVHTPATLEELLRDVDSQKARGEKKLWRDEPFVWWLFGLVLGFLTLEWLGRKWAGLP